ncbi:MAG TPA: NAD(P)H-hydrate dehydratase [Bacteroidales bacterium]|nr:NAD(P)H-hydrate dehydratase [Bacteroidales bacterium]
MKIPDADQIRAIDVYTIDYEPISSIDLMERAASKCFSRIKKQIRQKQKVVVFCGPGNNGGDGLAIARMLAGTGHNVEAYLMPHSEQHSAEYLVNLKRLKKIRNAKIVNLQEQENLPEIPGDALVVDALFGTGLNRPLEGFPSTLVQQINKSGAKIISIDIPSGLFIDDNRGNNYKSIIKASQTLTFQFPKLAFLLPENENYVGQWEILDIGLHNDAIKSTNTKHHLTEANDIRSFYRPRSKFSHKGNYGHALLLAGSEGKAGAAILASGAALRSGLGLLTVHLPANLLPILQAALPEAMCRADSDPQKITNTGDLESFNAIGFGPGTGTDTRTCNALKLLIQNSGIPLVIDADGINILAQNPTWFAFLPKGTILTPHPKEFERIAGKSTDGFQRLELGRAFAFKYSVYLILKGAHTAIICPDGHIFFNSTGNPGMATGGSGDVLTGIILGWLAQGYSPFQAALMGVYLHGMSGDLAAARLGKEGMLAGDIIFHLPKAIKKVF